MTPTRETSRRLSDDVIARAIQGDQAAWTEVFEHSFDKLRRTIRRRLDGPLRRKLDSVDIANSVMKDFCAKIGDLHFDCTEQMTAFLVKAAQQKVIDEYRRHHSQKRDLGMERPADGAEYIAADTPTPSRVIGAREHFDQILREAGSPEEADIIRMKANGDSTDEISKKVGVHPRTIQRILERLRKNLGSGD